MFVEIINTEFEGQLVSERECILPKIDNRLMCNLLDLHEQVEEVLSDLIGNRGDNKLNKEHSQGILVWSYLDMLRYELEVLLSKDRDTRAELKEQLPSDVELYKELNLSLEPTKK